ncbi:hypothetical protein BD770DRAFT_32849 [Pilaira anomala]|nr:hypothetical protein BD770DRAFT_32849 [Pilaira anomala]
MCKNRGKRANTIINKLYIFVHFLPWMTIKPFVEYVVVILLQLILYFTHVNALEVFALFIKIVYYSGFPLVRKSKIKEKKKSIKNQKEMIVFKTKIPPPPNLILDIVNYVNTHLFLHLSIETICQTKCH